MTGDLGASCPSCDHKAGFHVPAAERARWIEMGAKYTGHCKGAILPTPNLCLCRLTIEEVSGS